MFTVKIWFYLIQKDLFKILYWEKDTRFPRYRLIHFTLWDQGLTGGIDPWMGQFTSSCQQSSVPGHCHWQAISVLCKIIMEKMPKKKEPRFERFHHMINLTSQNYVILICSDPSLCYRSGQLISPQSYKYMLVYVFPLFWHLSAYYSCIMLKCGD